MGKYITTIRLYDKYDLGMVSTREDYAEQVRMQYELARDKMASTGLSLEAMSGDG